MNSSPTPAIPADPANAPAAHLDGWSDLLSGHHLAIVLVMASRVLPYAMNLYFTAALMPSIVADIGGQQYYAWVTTAFAISAIVASLFRQPYPRLEGTRACLCRGLRRLRARRGGQCCKSDDGTAHRRPGGAGARWRIAGWAWLRGEGRHTIRVYLQTMDFTAGSLRLRSNPSDTGTEHLNLAIRHVAIAAPMPRIANAIKTVTPFRKQEQV